MFELSGKMHGVFIAAGECDIFNSSVGIGEVVLRGFDTAVDNVCIIQECLYVAWVHLLFTNICRNVTQVCTIFRIHIISQRTFERIKHRILWYILPAMAFVTTFIKLVTLCLRYCNTQFPFIQSLRSVNCCVGNSNRR